MQFVLCGKATACKYLQSLGTNNSWIRVNDLVDAKNYNPDAFFFLDEKMIDSDFGFTKKPVFLNLVKTPKKDLRKLQNHIYGFNAWPYFLENNSWEVIGIKSLAPYFIAAALNKKFIFLPGFAGFIAPKVVVTIINEAYLALEENVGSRDDIDIAMKQGTNYPYGPFEWAVKIGLAEVAALLEVISKERNSFPVSKLLVEESKSKMRQ